MKSFVQIILIALTLTGAATAQAQDYPVRPVKLVAPFAPGGPVDIGARLLAPKLSEILGHQFYVENHPGGSGNIGTAIVAKAPGDGYTVLVISSGFVVNPSMFKLPFDTEKDLAPVSLVGLAPQVILVHPSVPAKNISELISLVKANPGKYSFGSAGLGTPGFLAGEMLKQAYVLDLVHVPFQNGGPAVVSTVGGHTPMVITTISSAAGQIQQGSLRALAVTSSKRSPELPNVPTLAESGVSNQESEVILGLLVPRSTPANIIDRLNTAIVRIVAQPDMRDRFAAAGFQVVGSTPDEFAARIKLEITKWANVIRDAKVKTEQ